MKTIAAALVVAFAAVLTACSGPDASAYQAVDQFYGAVQRNDVEAAVAMTEPAQQASIRGGLGQLHQMVPEGAPTSSANAGWNIQVNAGQPRMTVVTRTYTYPGGVVTARATLVDGPGQPRWLVRGFNINSAGNGSGAASAAAPTNSAPTSTPAASAPPSGEANSGAAPGDSGPTAAPSGGDAPADQGHSSEATPDSNSGSPVEGQ